MGIGAAAYTVAFLLVAVQRSDDSYWAFTFPALAIVVVGADLEFNVANVSTRSLQLVPAASLIHYAPDVCPFLVAQIATVHRRLYFPNSHKTLCHDWPRHLHSNFQKCFREPCDFRLLHT